jgi:imidazolonepropionase
VYGFNSNEQFITIDNAEIIIKSGKIILVGKKGDHSVEGGATSFSLEGGIVTPGLIDPHTHAFPPNDRSNEFTMRVNKSY